MSTSQETVFYDKKEAVIISAIALILMIIHHLDPRDMLKYNLSSTPLIQGSTSHFGAQFAQFAYFCRICVAIFAFSSGYAMWLHRKKAYDIKYLAKRAFNFLAAYWVVYALFLLYATITKDSIAPPYLHIHHLFGLYLNTEYICPISAWYVYFYLSVIAATPLIIGLYRQNHIITFLTTVIAIILAYLYQLYTPNIAVPINIVLNAIAVFMPCVIAGVIVAKYNVFEKSNQTLSALGAPTKIVIALIVIVASYFIRSAVFSIFVVHPFLIDTILSGLLIFSFILIIKNIPYSKETSNLLYFIGLYSMNLWFLQSIYFVGKHYPLTLIFKAQYYILIVPFAVLLILPFAMGLNYLQKFYSIK